MLRFFGKLYRPLQTNRSFIPTVEPSKYSNGQEALKYVQTLYDSKHYEEALKTLTQIEELYPTCTKAAKHYRGKVSMALLEQDGTLERLHIPAAK